MDKNQTAVLFILDRSGSMSNVADDVRGGFNALVEEQAAASGEATLTLVQFDHEYQVDYVERPMANVPPLDFHPRGTTALNDAIGRGIVELASAIAAKPKRSRPVNVVVVIMTDGAENSSREWSAKQVKAKIDEQTNKHGWKFVYAGANVDAFEEGRRLGVRQTLGFAANRVGTLGVMKQMSSLVNSVRDVRTAHPAAVTLPVSEPQSHLHRKRHPESSR